MIKWREDENYGKEFDLENFLNKYEYLQDDLESFNFDNEEGDE